MQPIQKIQSHLFNDESKNYINLLWLGERYIFGISYLSWCGFLFSVTWLEFQRIIND